MADGRVPYMYNSADDLSWNTLCEITHPSHYALEARKMTYQ
jgi:hypothetical protein